MSGLYTRDGEPIENVDPNGEYVSYNTSPRYRVTHDTLSPFCIYTVEHLMYAGAWCEICEGKRPWSD